MVDPSIRHACKVCGTSLTHNVAWPRKDVMYWNHQKACDPEDRKRDFYCAVCFGGLNVTDVLPHPSPSPSPSGAEAERSPHASPPPSRSETECNTTSVVNMTHDDLIDDVMAAAEDGVGTSADSSTGSERYDRGL